MQTDLQQEQRASEPQVGKRIMQATGALIMIQVILRGFGFIEKVILGRFFGASYLTDAYNAARDVAGYVLQIVDQVVMHSFLPVFVHRVREHGEEDAWRLASSVINILALIMVPVVILGIIFAPQALTFFMPDWFNGSNPEQNPYLVPLAINLTRMLLAAIIFLSASSMTYCLLNSYKKFALPQVGDLVLKATVLVCAALLAGKLGPTALAIGFVIGSVAKITVHSVGLGQHFRRYRPAVDIRHPGLKEFAILALPLLAGVVVSEFRQIMDARFISSLEEGSYAALKFARNLTDVPVNIFPFMFGIALFPFLADIAQSGDRERLRGMLMTVTRLMFLVFLPLAAVIFLLREPLIYIVYGKGSMEAAGPLQISALGMLIGALEIIVLQFFFAMKDTLRPTIVGMAVVPLHIFIASQAVSHREVGALWIAGALVVSKGAKISILYGLIRRKVGSLEAGKTLAFIGKVILALLPMVLLVGAAVWKFPSPHEVGESRVAQLKALLPYMASAGVGALCYVAVLHVLKVEEWGLVLDKVRGKLGKGRKAKA